MQGHISPVVASLQSGQPTLLLINLPATSPALISPLETGTSQPGLLVLVDADELDRVLPLGWIGASDWISRGDLVTNLASIAIAVQHGEMILPPALGQGASGQDALIDPLSEREIEVLRLLAQGLTNKDIAQTLCLSVLTVKTHLHHIFGKLGVRSRTEAALWATQHGYGLTE
ncbi:MAG: hypothetical protein BroJett011_13080 [Chloroflexota bacterium]|nr:MAG: hypothetical protein BroJett011_13080 [Chloroflexota bacterium]